MHRLEELSSAQARELMSRGDAVVVIPVGSVEQHCEGPLGTDLMIAQGVAEAACERVSGPCVLAPPIAYGFSAEWSLAPGTVSLSLRTLQLLLRDVITSLVRSGARNVVIVNGHYGNSPAVEAALRDMMPSLPPEAAVVQVNYWEALELDVGHASDAEAEVMKALGYSVDFGRCECLQGSPRGTKVYVRPGEGPATLRSPARGLTRDFIGSAVAEAIEGALRAARSSRRPLP
ncbi:MAG: creatininase family protein [Acidilobus sp.]